MPFSKTSLIILLRQTPGAELVHFYDQGQDDRLNQMDITADGWCHGVSVRWLMSKRLDGFGSDQFWTWLDSTQAAASMRFMMADQGIRGKIGNATDVDKKSGAHLRRAGLVHVAEPSDWSGNAVIANVGRDVLQPPGSYSRIGLYFNPSGGHAIAACVNGKELRFMDPNAGEIRFPDKASFQAFFPRFWQLRYGNTGLKNYYIEKYN